MVRIGLIGAGTMGRLYAQCLSEYDGSDLVAISDLDEERAACLAEQWSVPGVHQDYAQMFAREELDAVVLATPDETHRAPAVAALESGLHVLCEKPLATTVEDGLAMREAVSRSGKHFMVNFGNRHRSQAHMLRRTVLEEKAIGEICNIYVELNERVSKTETLAWAAKTSPIWFLLSHCVDFVRYVTDLEIRELFGYESRGVLVRRNVDTSDTSVFVGKLSNDGGIFLGSSWVYPDTFTRGIDFSLRLLGERGLVECQLIGQDVMLYADPPHVLDYQFSHADHTGKREGWWFRSTRYFVHCLEAGVHPTPDVEDGMRCLCVLRAMDTSVRTGKPIRVAYE
jgi:predicted dehydrogenase